MGADVRSLRADRTQRKTVSISLVFAMLVSGFLSEFQGVRKRHFGDDALTERQFFWVLGMTLETIGRTFRTGDPSPTLKGRVNVELDELIKLIRKRQKPEMNLLYRQLKKVLEFVLIHTPNEEALRLFVHRTQKRGWLQRRIALQVSLKCLVDNRRHEGAKFCRCFRLQRLQRLYFLLKVI